MGIGVAVVGLGERGRKWARLTARTRGFSLIALVDPRVELARAAKNALALDVPVFRSLEEAKRSGEADLEAVILASPLEVRAGHCREAMALGLHSLVEPPLSGSFWEALSLLRRARAKGLCFRQALWLRLSPALRAMKGALRGGKLGAITGGLFVHLYPPAEEGRTLQHLDALLSLVGREPQTCRREGYAMILDFGQGIKFGLAFGPSGEPMEGMLVVCEKGALLWEGRVAFLREGRRGLRWRLDDPLDFRWPERGEATGKFRPLPPDPGPSGEEVLLHRFGAEVEGGAQGRRLVEEEGDFALAVLEACLLAQAAGKPQSPLQLMEEGGEGVEAGKVYQSG